MTPAGGLDGRGDCPPDIARWLDTFAKKIREVDYTGARDLFSPMISGFGTKTEKYANLDEWHHTQWVKVWPSTRGFKFHFDDLKAYLSDDGSLCCVACTWSSEGIREDRTSFPRQGRSSILLSRCAHSTFGWVGIHSHFSQGAADLPRA